MGGSRRSYACPAPPAAGGGISAEQIKAIVEPLVASQSSEQTAKDRDQAAAASNMERCYQLMFGGFVDPKARILEVLPAELTPKFKAILEKRQPIPAANDFKDEIASRVAAMTDCLGHRP